jgi:hypothetical protein
MSVVVWANNAGTTLAAAITSAQTTITLTSGSGALFPSPAAGQFFPVTLISQSNANTFEITYCTARSGDTLTVERAQEGTTALAFVAGDFARLLPTAGTLAEYGQLGAANTWTAPQTFSDSAVASTLTVTGVVNVGGNLTVDENANVVGTATAGAIVSTGTASVDGNLSVGGNAGIVGALTAPAGSSGSQVVNFSQFPFSVAGFQKLPSGFLIQWGSIDAVDNTTTIGTFPIAFPNQALVFVCNLQASIGSNTFAVGGQPISNSQFEVTNTNQPGSAQGVSWIAIGF